MTPNLFFQPQQIKQEAQFGINLQLMIIQKKLFAKSVDQVLQFNLKIEKHGIVRPAELPSR